MQSRASHIRKRRKPLRKSGFNQAEISWVKPPRLHNLPYKVTTSKTLQVKTRKTQEWWLAHKAKHIHKEIHINIAPSTTPILQPKSITKHVIQHSHHRREVFQILSNFQIFLFFIFLFFSKKGGKEKSTKKKSRMRDVPCKLKIALFVVLLKVKTR